jgi:hypothetical protein
MAESPGHPPDQASRQIEKVTHQRLKTLCKNRGRPPQHAVKPWKSFGPFGPDGVLCERATIATALGFAGAQAFGGTVFSCPETSLYVGSLKIA